MYAYCQNNPVMMVDPDGKNPLALVLVVAGTISPVGWMIIGGIVVIGAAVYIGQTELGEKIRDGIDNTVDNISQAASNLKNNIKEKINSTSVAISTAIVAAKKLNNGTYAIQFSNGKYYIGKGGPLRMYTSAMRGFNDGAVPVSFRHEWAKSDKEAFIKEYKWMVEYGYERNNPDFYNVIWSPGRLYYAAENNGKLYLDDSWRR